jgi:DNA processing protein
MDAVSLRLVLGRASGLRYQQLRSAVEKISAQQPETGQPEINAVDALIGERAQTLQSLGIGAAASAWLQAPDARTLAADREWIARDRIQLLDAFDPRYPPLLRHLRDAPALLYVRGEIEALSLPQLAIVGSRGPTLPGRLNAMRFAAELSLQGLTITSGLALGIDAAAHDGALSADGRTIAVLGSGLDRIYPERHGRLAARIAARGALISEFPRGTPPLRHHFPQRNRLMSGLSLGTLVVEAARDSGSLITAQFALDQGREVFAIPGSIYNRLTRGCHQLIRSGAKLVESTDDIFEEIAISLPKQDDMSRTPAPRRVTPRSATLDKGHKILLDALGFDPASINTLVERTGFPSRSVASMLSKLELEGVIGSEAGGCYVRLDGRPG